jgi:DNA-binding NarL/FixJ family response regulator
MNVLLVDDHTLVRRGLAHVVTEQFADAVIVEASSGDEALKLLKQSPSDIALLDVRLEGMDGIELLKAIKRDWPRIPVIMLTSFNDARYARQALAEGAAGYILKDSNPADLDQAIRVAMAGGGNVLSTGVMKNLFEEMETAPAKSPEVLAESLSKREVEIMELLVDGKSNREIAEVLFLSEKTVKAHLAAIFRKLDVGNRTQAAMIGVSIGIKGRAASGRAPAEKPAAQTPQSKAAPSAS